MGAFIAAIIAALTLLTPVNQTTSIGPPGLKPCATEDSAGPCYWDAQQRGNGLGHSFWIDAHQHRHFTN